MKILISRPDKIGDVILSLHCVKQLKHLWPEATVYMHLSEVTIPLVKMVRFVDGIVGLDEDLRGYKFDAVVDLMAKNWTSRMYYRAKIPLRIGNSARWFCYRFNRTTSIHRSRALMNEAEYNWQLIRLLHPKLKNTQLQECFSKTDLLSFCDKGKEEYTVLMPGISISAIPWERNEWIGLAKLLANLRKVIVILGPAEKDQYDIYKSALAETPNVEILCVRDFPSLLGILSSAYNYVGPSTGVTHLASAFDLPGVALYPEFKRGVHPRRWQPFQSTLKVLSLCRDLSVQDVCLALDGKSLPDKEPMLRRELSAFVICCNEEKNIRRCLESIKWCDEIVVVDSGSTDETLSICREYTSNIIHQPWLGYIKQKQFALEQCTKDWVLNIDSDEEVSFELRNRLEHILSYSNIGAEKIQGYTINRLVYYLGLWWDKGCWHREYRLRFFQRISAKWIGEAHEKVKVIGKVKRLHESIYHFPFSDTLHQMKSLLTYSDLSATCKLNMGVRSSIIKLLVSPPCHFFKFYVLKRGYRHGMPGLIVSVIGGFGTFFKYAKLWELQQSSSDRVQCEHKVSVEK